MLNFYHILYHTHAPPSTPPQCHLLPHCQSHVQALGHFREASALQVAVMVRHLFPKYKTDYIFYFIYILPEDKQAFGTWHLLRLRFKENKSQTNKKGP